MWNYDIIVDQFQAMMYYTAFNVVKDKQTAEDVVQETWIKVLKQGKKITQVEKLGSWLKTITTRTAIDLLRKEKRSHTCLFQDPNWLEELDLCAGDFVEERLNCSILLEELEQCIGNQQKLLAVFQLKFRLEFDNQQIAEMLNISNSAVKTRLFRIRKLLKRAEVVEDFSEFAVGA
ncbi:RNA polymerase sigma factor [Gracilibacillus timonensis]|uniref:RNA polymerase sigma factor n=1 Tax=Gracilibacillus timonensis TaxID=1816696 RepID=UPI000AD7F954|nr:RNA polymerase sigma factor [Gracilibacillus timonensis]